MALAVALVFVAVLSDMVDGLPFAVTLAIAAIVAIGVLPSDARRYFLRRTGRVALSLFLSMAFVWLLVHNYPDLSRPDDTGLFAAMERYVTWIGGLVSGDLGPSSQYSEPVGEGVSRTLPISLQLLAYSQVIAVALAVPGAAIGARLRGRSSDLLFRALALLGLSLPVFVIGPVLMQLLGVNGLRIFGRNIGVQWFPVVRYEALRDGVGDHVLSMALPSITLAISTAAIYMVLLRSEMIQQLTQDHAELARSKGLSPAQIVWRHAMRPGASPAIAAIAAQAGMVLGNMIIVERIFTLPGFGDYVIIAIGRRDVEAVAGAIFVAALIVGVINLFAEALLLVVDPRLTR